MPTFDEAPDTFGFGKKYRNREITSVPDDYLNWVLESCDNIDDFLRRRINQELTRRAREGIVIEEDKLSGNNRYYHSSNFDEVSDGLPF